MGLDNDEGWWGYIHVDGSLHAKRYFDDACISEAAESPFVDTIFTPSNYSREEIIAKMKKWKEDHI